MARGVADGFLESLRAQDLEDGAENLVLIAAVMRLHMVEQSRPHEIALLMALQAEAAPVDDQLGAFVHGHLDIAFDARAVLGP